MRVRTMCSIVDVEFVYTASDELLCQCVSISLFFFYLLFRFEYLPKNKTIQIEQFS